MSQQPQQVEIADFSASLGIASSGSERDETTIASTATSEDGVQNAVAFDGNFFDSFAMSSLQMTASAILAAQLAEQTSGGGGATRDDRSHSIVSASESDTSEAKGKSTTKRSETHAGDEKPHVERHKWTQDETQALVDGCNKHGIGNWKAILSDEQLSAHFEGRTPGDLKDRFRTYFPDAYHEMYPNAKTHNSRAIRSRAPDGSSIFEKGKTKERRPFTHAEDEVLKRGYEKFGSHWAIIAKEPVFEGKRKSTDLRDRFRNSFPSLYEQAGYKPRTKAHKREQRHSGSGTFTQAEQGHGQSASEPRCSFSSSTRLERPNLGWRSDTSISASSQAVSEHSEEETQSESWRWPYGESLEHISMQGAATSLMSRSKSFEASSLQTSAAREYADNAATQSNAGTTRTAVSPLGHASTSAAKHGLRRTQSSKRSSSKIVNQEHAAKSASIKSNKEALLASHQHSHQQHLQQHRHQQKQQHVEMNVQDDSWRRAASESQLPLDFTQMDLDPTGEGVQGGDTVAQLDGSTSTEAPESFQTADTSLAKSATLDAFPSDENPGSLAASNAYLANLYRELGYGGQREAPAQRTFTVDSFQDLLDPLAPQQSTGARWTGSIPLQVPYEIGSMQQSSAGTSRNHEHHHWAGDLLHRGSTAPFAEWPPMQMGTSFGDYAADVRQDGTQQPEQTPNVSRRAPSTVTPQVQHRSISDYTSGVGFSEMNSRPARRLSNPPRPFGSISATSTLQAQNAMQQQQSVPFSMDDLFLLSSSVSAYAPGIPPFLSEVSSGNGVTFDASASADVEDVLRRRRSTDTLRGNANEIMRTFDAEADNVGDAANAAVEESSLPGSAIDAQTDGERMRALLAAFSAANNDEADLPSRAASLGNLDLAVGRDQAFYAESLPDLTSSAFAGERSSSASETLFPPSQQQQLPISFDDLDLPSFLNRSPAVAPLTSAGQSNSATFGSSKVSRMATDLSWPSRSGSLRTGGDSSGVRSGTSINVRDGLPNAFLQPFTSAAFSTALNDAGTLDRLEHLYLEGLHTPASPSVSFTQPQSSSAGITPFVQQSHRFAAGSTLPQITTSAGFPSQDGGARMTQSSETGNGYESA